MKFREHKKTKINPNKKGGLYAASESYCTLKDEIVVTFKDERYFFPRNI